MSTNTSEIQGTLSKDGTLVLDEKPNLPPGRVKVTVQAVPDYKQTDVWQFFERIKAERESLGVAPSTQEAIDAYISTMRDDDERCRTTERIHKESRRPPDQPQGDAS